MSVGRFRKSIVILAAASLFVALNSNKMLNSQFGGLAPLTYQFFSQERRGLARIDDHLWPYNGEKPLGDTDTVFLLGIFSTESEKYAHRREYIRKTYLSTGDDRICKLEEYKRQQREQPNDVRCQIPYTFVIGGGDASRPSDHDDDEPLTLETHHNGHEDPEGDCTYLNIKENMENGKSTTYMKFGAMLAKEYGIDYIGKTDDDTVLAIQLLLQFLDDDLPPAPFNRRIYGGTSWASWAHNHMYAAGQFYFLSSDLADYVSIQLTAKDRRGMMHSRPTEDADMGTFIFSHPRPIKFISLSTFRFWHHPKKTEKDFLDSYSKINALPGFGLIMPFWHLCPAWIQGKGV